VPNKGEQMVRYYGYYSNVCRGKRQKAGQDQLIPCILEPDENLKAYRKNWARLIQKIYEVDPLTCPKCRGPCGSSLHPGPGSDRKDPETPRLVACQTQSPAQGERPSQTARNRLLGFSGSLFRRAFTYGPGLSDRCLSVLVLH